MNSAHLDARADGEASGDLLGHIDGHVLVEWACCAHIQRTIERCTIQEYPGRREADRGRGL